MTNINIKLDETKENTDMCQAMQEIIEDAKNDVRKEYIDEINKQRAETNEAKANEEKAKAEIIVLKERIAQLEKAAKKQNQ